jgi:hypothetical protein
MDLIGNRFWSVFPIQTHSVHTRSDAHCAVLVFANVFGVLNLRWERGLNLDQLALHILYNNSNTSFYRDIRTATNA